MNFRLAARVLGVVVLVLTGLGPGWLGASAAVPGPSQDLTCSAGASTGQQLTSTPWPQQQLTFQAAGVVTKGLYLTGGSFDGQRFAAGDPVRVAVVDSGMDVYGKFNKGIVPAFKGADIAPVKQIENWHYEDCVGHGTEVTSLIVAQQGNHSLLSGVAPQVRLIPIQYTNSESSIPVGNLIAALTYAIAQHPRVINLSLQSRNAPTGRLLALYKTAERDGIIIVAAGGNEGSGTTQGCITCYPAALSPTMRNVIAVSAVDKDGQSAGFGVTGHYVDVSAPGVDVPVAVPTGGFGTAMGTSFATPFVTGTVALMLAADPDMTPAQVRHRLESTATPPPGNVPDTDFGYGAVDPLLAVTSVQDDAVAVPSPGPGPPLAVPHTAVGPSRALAHRALGIAVVLLGLAVLTVVGAAILRGNRNAQTRRT